MTDKTAAVLKRWTILLAFIVSLSAALGVVYKYGARAVAWVRILEEIRAERGM